MARAEPSDGPGPGARAALALVHAYQLLISPFTGGACRFEPSCSAYALEAIRAHGAWRGLGLALRRIARCHPFAGHGFDPVPPPVRRHER